MDDFFVHSHFTIYTELNIFVQGQRFKAVGTFIDFGSTLTRDCSLDSKINLRIEKASKAFSELEKCVWLDRDISINRKISVYQLCVLTDHL